MEKKAFVWILVLAFGMVMSGCGPEQVSKTDEKAESPDPGHTDDQIKDGQQEDDADDTTDEAVYAEPNMSDEDDQSSDGGEAESDEDSSDPGISEDDIEDLKAAIEDMEFEDLGGLSE
ncbi:hypothetical protein GF351_05800 [Candidatus Woesearchaeota archaeon]|nr:hypothetical protein [Candidatus Woesearchaeota archaeon]